MLSVVATLKVKEDKIEEARTFFKDLEAETLANESGTLEYKFFQQRGEPATFVCIEKYEDDAAFGVHGQNLAAKGAAFAALLDGRPAIVMLEDI